MGMCVGSEALGRVLGGEGASLVPNGSSKRSRADIPEQVSLIS